MKYMFLTLVVFSTSSMLPMEKSFSAPGSLAASDQQDQVPPEIIYGAIKKHLRLELHRHVSKEVSGGIPVMQDTDLTLFKPSLQRMWQRFYLAHRPQIETIACQALKGSTVKTKERVLLNMLRPISDAATNDLLRCLQEAVDAWKARDCDGNIMLNL